MSKDYYEILGVSRDATKEEIKKAYKKLAKKYHPDISKEPDAEHKFKEINEAASVLLDDEKRRQYDQFGTVGDDLGSFSGFNPEDFGINLNDIFEEFFSSFGFRDVRRDFARKEKVVTITLSLDEVYHGTSKNITVKRKVKCEYCDGTGAEDGKLKKCEYCNGTGVITEIQRTFFGVFKTQKICRYCNGKGYRAEKKCKKCEGKGYIEKRSNIEVDIPKGIEEGMKLRIKGKGDYDIETDNYNDLYVEVHYKEDPIYDWEGYDLYTSITINVTQAILGDSITIKHFGKELEINIPQGTQPGTILRVKNKGLPIFNTESHGDLYIKVKIEIPKKLTSKQKKLVEELAKELNKNSIFKKFKKFLDKE